MSFRLSQFLIVAMAALSIPGAASAAHVAAATPATDKATILHPLTLLKTADLLFGTLIVNGAGTAVVNPVSDVETTTGGVVMAGGGPHSASFTGGATGLSLIYVQQPQTAITLTHTNGTTTMTANNFTLQNGNFYLTTAVGTFSFRVGATLTVAAGQLDGLYTGTFNVDAYYF